MESRKKNHRLFSQGNASRKGFLMVILSLVTLVSFAQGFTVTGVVRDAGNQPIVGAYVLIDGTLNGTSTDVDGKYALNNVPANAKLTVTYLGYKTVTTDVASRRIIDFVMEEDASLLDELIVVGYAVQKKSDVTGALVRVGAKEMKAMPVTNALQAMQGKAAGIDITSNERPGEMGSIRIRGERSLNATNAPLYVVDGIPLQGTGIDNINPSDIESIDVLKDASATAIYGSRGANGVILVTTKRGTSGQFTLNYSGTLSIENMHDRTTMMNSAQWLDMSRLAKIRNNSYGGATAANYESDKAVFATDPYAWAQIEKGWSGSSFDGSRVPTYDWTSAGLQTAYTNEHTLSASGGTDKMQAYGSFGYLHQGGTQPGQQYERFTGKLSVDFTPVNWFKMGLSANVSYGDQDYGYNFRKSATGASNLYFALQGMLPWTVPYTDEGEYIRNPGGDVNIINPIRETDLCVNERLNTRIFGSTYAELDFGKMVSALDGLRFRVNFGPDFRNGRTGIADSAESINGDGNNIAQYSTDFRRSWTLDELLYYNKTIAEKHTFGITLLHSASAYHYEGAAQRAFVNSFNEKWYNTASLSNIQSYSTSLSETSMESYMARLNYNFDDKYLLTVSTRWDGASQLADGNKWDFFPSAALGWRIDQEDFMDNATWMDQLKLRAGYGITGNSAIDAYATKGAVTTAYYHFGSITSTGMIASDPAARTPVVMANSDLGWEKTTQINIGLDFGFFGNRINGSIDLYKSHTDDLLMTKSLPSLTGYMRTWANVGKTENKGIDITLNSVNIDTHDFTWSSTLTFSADRSKIVELADGNTEDISNNWFVGQQIGTYYDYVYDGIWKTSEATEAASFGRLPGEIRIKDLNGDGAIDANNDRTFVGNARPKWSGGFLNTFTYKGFELSAFLYARWGFTVLTGSETLSGRFAQRLVDYWVAGTNEDAEYYAPGVNGESGDTYKTSMQYRDGSFIKLRNVSLGYNFNSNLIHKAGLSNLKIYVQCMNPTLVYSKIDWIDPDLGGSTFNRSFVFGVNIGF